MVVAIPLCTFGAKSELTMKTGLTPAFSEALVTPSKPTALLVKVIVPKRGIVTPFY